MRGIENLPFVDVIANEGLSLSVTNTFLLLLEFLPYER
jgi:hypothetical protein